MARIRIVSDDENDTFVRSRPLYGLVPRYRYTVHPYAARLKPPFILRGDKSSFKSNRERHRA